MFQTENNVKIEGILSENNIKEGSFNKNGKIQETLTGNVVVKTTHTLKDKTYELEIPVNVFTLKYKNDGSLNPVYSHLYEVMTTYKSIAAVGEDAADYVRIIVGNSKRVGDAIRMNEYYKEDKLVSYPRIHGTFINKISKTDMTPQATFSMVFLVKSISEEIDKDGIETGRVKVEACPVLYGDRVDVVPLYSANEKLASDISSHWAPGDTVRATGFINFSYETITRTESQDFGDEVTRSYTHQISELLIEGGSNPMEGDFALNKEEIKAGLKERQARLEASKEKKEIAKPAAKKMDDLGF